MSTVGVISGRTISELELSSNKAQDGLSQEIGKVSETWTAISKEKIHRQDYAAIAIENPGYRRIHFF